MRIPLESVDAINDDPDAFKDEVESEEQGYARPGRNYHMQNALLKWHKGDLSLDEARQEVIAKCEKYRDTAESERTIEKFDRYAEDYQEATDIQTRFVRMKVVVPLPKGVDRRFEVSGKVRRLDKHSDGTYTAWLFAKEADESPSPLHLPLFQNAVANRLNLDLDEIRIGVYCFGDGSRQIYQFDQKQLDAARNQLKTLLLELSSLAEREPMPPQMEMDFEE